MRVFVFTKKQDYAKVIKVLCAEINKNLIVEEVSEEQLVLRASSNRNDLFIIDDRLISSVKKDYMQILSDTKSDVILLLEDRDNIKRYLSLNIVDYFTSPILWKRMETCIRSVYKKMEMLRNLDSNQDLLNKFIIKGKKEILILDYDDILFFEKAGKYVKVHLKTKIHLCDSILRNIIELVPEHFVRVHNSYIVNFDKVSKIIDVGKKSYSIEFEDYENFALMSRYKSEELITDKLKKYEMNYILESKKRG